MSWTGDAISVYPLVEEWSFNITENGITGTRVYLENLGQITDDGVTPTTLPNIGDVWDSDYNTLTVKSINSTYISKNVDCGKKFSVSYDTNAFVQQEQVAALDLPVSVDIGGDMMSIEPSITDSDGVTTYYMHWKSDSSKKVNQPIFKHSVVANVQFSRVVDNFESYMKTCFKYYGHINNAQFFGFPYECVMFTGVSLVPFKNKMGNDRWKATLTFSVRNVTNNFSGSDGNGATNGWNYVLRKDPTSATTKWDRPVNSIDGTYLYSTKDFDALMNEGKLQPNEAQFNKFPHL